MSVLQENVISTLKEHILVDGFHHVMDFERSHGSWLVDKVDGKEYLDCFGQFASLALGYNHHSLLRNKYRLTNAALHKIVNSDLYSVEYASFVDKLFKFALPDYFKYSFFIEGGAPAVENALKVAFDWKAKRMGYKIEDEFMPNYLNVIHFDGCFHGRLGYSIGLTKTGKLKNGLFPNLNWPSIVAPHTTNDNVEEREKLSLNQAKDAFLKNKIAAIILEPQMGEGGNYMFRKEYIQQLRELADENDSLLIFDEVQTGMGASGKWWLHEHYGVEPDIMVFGKKMQVCGITATTKNLDKIPDHCFKQSGRINSTWGGNIVDMVRAEIIIDTIVAENLIENTAKVGRHLISELNVLSQEFPEITNVRGIGTLVAIDFPTTERRNEVLEKLRPYMVILGCGSRSIRFRPALTFSENDAAQAIDFFRAALV